MNFSFEWKKTKPSSSEKTTQERNTPHNEATKESSNLPSGSQIAKPTFPTLIADLDKELCSLLTSDPILNDLMNIGGTLSSERVEALLAFETGQGVRLLLKRDDGTTLPINIKKKSNILQLKKRIRTETEAELELSKMTEMEDLQRRSARINWKHVWRQNWLVTEDNLKLKDDTALLKDVGLINNSVIKFCKKLREKTGKGKASKKRKRVWQGHQT